MSNEKVKEQMEKDAFELELNILAVLQYDFEFEFPFTHVNQFFAWHVKPNYATYLPESLQKELHANCHAITRDTYLLHDYCLYYSPTLLAATAIWLGLRHQISQSQPGETKDQLIKLQNELCQVFSRQSWRQGQVGSEEPR